MMDNEITTQIQHSITEAFTKHAAEYAVTVKRLETLESTVNNHDKFIDGNGNPGAKVSISLLTQQVQKMNVEFKDFTDKLNSRVWALALLVIGTLLTSILNLVIK